MDKLQKEIKKLPYHLEQYIYFRYPELKFQPTELTEEIFLERVGRKTMNTYNRFARSEQFRLIEALVLQEKMSKNIFKIYEEVSKKALEGNGSKAIADMLKLQKAVNEIIKRTENSQDEFEDVEEDDLI